MPKDASTPTPSTQEIAERGEAIYEQKYRKDFEATHPGKFVAINIRTGEATPSETAEDAIRIALEKDSNAFLHLLRVGHKAAFEAGWYMSCAG